MAFDEGEWSASSSGPSPPSGAEVMIEWIYTSSAQHGFMTCTGTKFISILPLPFFYLTFIVRHLNPVFVLTVRSFLRDGPLNAQCPCRGLER